MSDAAAMKEIDLNAIVQSIWGRPLTRAPRTYGASSVGFCLEKQVLRRTMNAPFVQNGSMLVGKVLHESFFAQIADEAYPDRWRLWGRKKFERVVTFEDPRGFHVEGHCDCDLPRHDRILEFKSTRSMLPFERGNFITEAYIEQANAYAIMSGRGDWEIWVAHLSTPVASKIMARISGPSSQEAFDDFLDRVFFVDQAVMNGTHLNGPEQGWECKRCQFLFDCPSHQALIRSLIAKLPSAKKDLTEAEAKELDLLNQRKVVKYDRTARVWRYVVNETN